MKKSRLFCPFLCTAAAAILLTGCQTTQPPSLENRVNSAIDRAGNQQSSRGPSLSSLESAYKRNPDDVKAAVGYAAALNEAGRYNRASAILQPFLDGKNAKNEKVLAEFSSIQIALGNYNDAEHYARKAVLANPESGKAYHYLGIALDAQGQAPQAEVAFRKALELWEGDPVPVMNNLGLNLASQGFVDDALDMLRKAAALAPDRPEIERNIRIVSALQQQHKPSWEAKPESKKIEKKPDDKKADEKKVEEKKPEEKKTEKKPESKPASLKELDKKAPAHKAEPVAKEPLDKGKPADKSAVKKPADPAPAPEKPAAPRKFND